MDSRSQIGIGCGIALVLLAAVVCDIRSRKIPNSLVVAGLLLGFGVHITAATLTHASVLSALRLSLFGAGVGLILLLPGYLFGILGAGDVKLMAALGAFLGPMPVAGAVILTLLAGGVLSLVAMFWSRSTRQVWTNMQTLMVNTAVGGGLRRGVQEISATGRLPYALAIACGTVVQYGLMHSIRGRSLWMFA